MDNTALNPGVGGDTIATEEIAGVKYEKVKLIDPTPLSTAPIGVAANPLRTDPTGTTTQPISAATLPLPTGAATDAILTGGTQRSQIYDPQFAASVMVDSLRGIRSHQMVRLFGDNFSDGLGIGKDVGTFPTFVACTDTATGGVITGFLQMRTGSTNNGAGATLQSLKKADRVSATLSGLQTGIKFPSTPTTWKIVSRKDGVDSPVTSFNGTANTPDGNFHRYELFYQGPGSAKFIVDGVLLHSLSGQPSTPRTSTLDLTIRYEIVNDAVNTVARAGMFDSNNGYFYEAVYSVADLTMSVHGSSCLVFGPAVDAYGYGAPLALNAAQESSGNLQELLRVTEEIQVDLLRSILVELRTMTFYLKEGLNVRDEIDSIRDSNRTDPNYTVQ